MTMTELREWHDRLFGASLTLPAACIDLRMAVNGSSDPWPAEKVKDAVDYLRHRLSYWRDSNDAYRAVDDAVRNLVQATLGEVCRDDSWQYASLHTTAPVACDVPGAQTTQVRYHRTDVPNGAVIFRPLRTVRVPRERAVDARRGYGGFVVLNDAEADELVAAGRIVQEVCR